MHSDSCLRFERTDNELIVQSEPTSAFIKFAGLLHGIDTMLGAKSYIVLYLLLG